MPELRKVPIMTIREPAMPIREAMDEAKLAELAESMKAIGLIQPIAVKGNEFGWEIVAGHRRYMAARMLGWVEIDCICRAPEEMQADAAMLAENIFREDLTAAEEAIWLSDLAELKKVDTIGLAELVHKSQDWVEDRLRLFAGDKEVFEALRRRDINFSVARELNKYKDESLRRAHLDVAIRSTPPARLVAKWRTDGELLPPANLETTNGVAAAEAQPETPCEDPGCFLCGGNKDPYNLRYVKLHVYCERQILQQMERAGRE